jgi:hypothetical protein
LDVKGGNKWINGIAGLINATITIIINLVTTDFGNAWVYARVIIISVSYFIIATTNTGITGIIGILIIVNTT